jgi:hypothetical protein
LTFSRLSKAALLPSSIASEAKAVDADAELTHVPI